MKVRSIFRPGIACVTPADTLRDAARKMRSTGQSCLPVVEGSSVTAILTEKDVTTAVAKGVSASETRVGDYANDGSITVSLNDDCYAAELKMLAIGCRNLPVVDDGRLVGSVSMHDVLLNAAPAATAPAPLSDEWPEEPPPDVDSEG